GFDSLSIPLPAGREATGRSAYIGDANPNMNWRSQVTAGAVNFSTDLTIPGFASGGYPMPTALPTLDWGSLYSFSFVSDAPPVAGSATLHVAQSGSPASYTVATLVPAGSARIAKAN
ncbi:MAG: hypothetical protein ABIR62_16700, partial [Dokdonella sp.]|uniref:hypothetical protein n=1 Tax=Dokdonella sp. TaxID=2291710 RepID=UPI0032653692